MSKKALGKGLNSLFSSKMIIQNDQNITNDDKKNR